MQLGIAYDTPHTKGDSGVLWSVPNPGHTFMEVVVSSQCFVCEEPIVDFVHDGRVLLFEGGSCIEFHASVCGDKECEATDNESGEVERTTLNTIWANTVSVV